MSELEMATVAEEEQDELEHDDGAGWAIIPSPIRDGSAVIAHDGYDVQEFRTACREYTKLQATIDAWTQRVYTAGPLVRDLFWAFFRRAPKIDPVVPLTSAYEYNRMILEQILTTSEYHSLYAAGTADDVLTSAMATWRPSEW